MEGKVSVIDSITGKFQVVTQSGTVVFEGSWRQCYTHVMQELAKGRKPGELAIKRKGIGHSGLQSDY